jgi:DNA repair protein RecO (recombination protein O)
MEAMLRLFSEQEANARAFEALTRFLDVLETNTTDVAERARRPALDPLALSFQLKLLWLSGYLPHLGSCAECGADGPLAAYSPRAGGAVCRSCAVDGALVLTVEESGRWRRCSAARSAEAVDLGLSDRAARDCLAVISSSYEYHGGFRLRTLAAG